MGLVFFSLLILLENVYALSTEYPAPVRNEVTRIELFLSNCNEPVWVQIDEHMFPKHIWKEKVLHLLDSSLSRPCPLALGSWSLDLVSERNAKRAEDDELKKRQVNELCSEMVAFEKREAEKRNAAGLFERLWTFGKVTDLTDRLEKHRTEICRVFLMELSAPFVPLDRSPNDKLSFITYTPISTTARMQK